MVPANSRKKSVTLVFGYIPEIDDEFQLAKKNGLNSRLAVVMDSHDPTLGEMHYDGEMFFRLLKMLLVGIEYDTTIVTNGEESQTFHLPLEDLRPQQVVMRGIENDPFNQIRFQYRNKITCIVNYEPYNAIGGPMPYHDSYTFSFYLSHFDQNKIITCTRELCERTNYTLAEAISGNEKPKISMLTKLKRLF